MQDYQPFFIWAREIAKARIIVVFDRSFQKNPIFLFCWEKSPIEGRLNDIACTASILKLSFVDLDTLRQLQHF